MIRFGGPIWDVDDTDPQFLAREYRKRGYRAAYAPLFPTSETGKIEDARRAFEAEDVMIAEVGYWQNLLDTDEKTCDQNRKEMIEALTLAEMLGARCAVDVLGSYALGKASNIHVAENFSQKAFDDAVYLARYFIDTVKPKTAYFAYELSPFSVIDSTDMVVKLIKAVDRKQFGVHLDVVNLVNCPRLYWKNAELIKECMKAFGDHIVSSHVKDIKMIEPSISVIMEEVIAGEGIMDIGTYVYEKKKPTNCDYSQVHRLCVLCVWLFDYCYM